MPQAWTQDAVGDTETKDCAGIPVECVFIRQPVSITFAGLSFAAGASPMLFESARQQNVLIREKVQMWRRNEFDYKPLYFDNIIQYVPVSAVVLLNMVGVPSRHNNMPLLRRTALTMLLTFAVTQTMKYTITELRPDRSSSNSFPSGHTAFAFSGAELLRLEYGETSALIPVAGYAVAALTGFMRIYNDRHWAGDVMAGAALGIVMADVSYWLNEWMDRRVWTR